MYVYIRLDFDNDECIIDQNQECSKFFPFNNNSYSNTTASSKCIVCTAGKYSSSELLYVKYGVQVITVLKAAVRIYSARQIQYPLLVLRSAQLVRILNILLLDHQVVRHARHQYKL